MKRDAASGILLIVGALTGMVVMVLHPTAHGLLSHGGSPHLAHLNVVVHSLALAATPVLFLGMLGVARRLGWTDLTTAGLVAFGFGGVAVMSAAVASGFVAPGVIERILAREGSTIPDAFLAYTGLWNQGFAKVHVVAYCVGILLASTAIVRSDRLTHGVAIAGFVVGAVILLGLLAGHLVLDVHGFGVVTFLQAGWFIWLGVLLCREPGASR